MNSTPRNPPPRPAVRRTWGRVLLPVLLLPLLWALPGGGMGTAAAADKAAGGGTNAAPAIRVGDRFPDLAGFGIEGDLPRELRGKVVVLDFWASWCGPCQESFPLMEDLYQKYRQKGLVVVAVNVDESRSAMKAFLADNPVSFPVVRDAKRRLVAQVNVVSMPTSFLLDRDGVVRFMHPGYKGHETKRLYTREIEQLLRAPDTNAVPAAPATPGGAR